MRQSYHQPIKTWTVVILAFGGLSILASQARGAGHTARQIEMLPLGFTENQGQQAPEVLFTAVGRGRQLSITGSSLNLLMGPQSDQAVRFQFLGANPNPKAGGETPMHSKSHYLIGDDPSRWRCHIPNFRQVRVSQLYPGIDLLYYGHMNELEYDLVVSAGSDPSLIRVACTTDADSDVRLSINAAGDLVISTAMGNIVKRKPVSYQLINGKQHFVQSAYRIIDAHAGVYGFALGDHDPAYDLVIDPILVYSTYLGGSQGDWLFGIACDADGHVYVSGNVLSYDFPTTGGTVGERSNGSIDTVVLKFHGQTHELMYATYVGGNDIDYGGNIAVDAEGCAYLTGNTDSTDLPVTPGAYDTSYNGNLPGVPHDDIFVIKLNPAGDRVVYGTYLGGSRGENPNGIAVDHFGCAYIVGQSASADFPVTAGAFDSSFNGGGDPSMLQGDVVVAKLSADGSRLEYATFLGGSAPEYPLDVTVDDQERVVVVGTTESPDFPTSGDYADKLYHGNGDGFATQLDATGGRLLYSSFLGGSGGDSCTSLHRDQANTLYVAGDTSSVDLPVTQGAYDMDYSGGPADGFVARIDGETGNLEACSFLGGRQDDGRLRVTGDLDHLYVVGGTSSADFPVTPNAYDPTYNGPVSGATAYNGDLFVTEMSRSLDDVVFSTFLGGSGGDSPGDACMGSSGSICIAGMTDSADFPMTPNAYDDSANPDWDGFFISFVPDPSVADGPVHNLNSDKHYDRIQHALLDANDGDEIVVAPGVYHEPLVLAGRNPRLRSLDPNDPFTVGGTIIQGRLNAAAVTLSHNTEACQLAGLTLRTGLAGVVGTATNATIRNCRIMDNVTHGLELSEAASPHLLNCLISGNNQTGISMYAGTGRRIMHCKPVIQNCVIVDNGAAAIVGGEPVIIDSIVQD